eukprot:TRINITY_DN11751_c0_g1_i1.p2 TRINITY_DN11751_c0_g1~~TRINITY_DN11751_c0_g1_i1.p2  ORF type:complete len:210 (+),score=-9.06 TRINITY_DN11751_c0_g1_i1:876-1505(+)
MQFFWVFISQQFCVQFLVEVCLCILLVFMLGKICYSFWAVDFFFGCRKKSSAFLCIFKQRKVHENIIIMLFIQFIRDCRMEKINIVCRKNLNIICFVLKNQEKLILSFFCFLRTKIVATLFLQESDKLIFWRLILYRKVQNCNFFVQQVCFERIFFKFISCQNFKLVFAYKKSRNQRVKYRKFKFLILFCLFFVHNNNNIIHNNYEQFL